MSALYSDFDKVAWYWPWDAHRQLSLLQLLSTEEDQEFTRCCRAYVKNLEAAVKAVSTSWHDLLDILDKSATLPAQSSGASEQHDESFLRMRADSDKLRDERIDLVSKMADLVK
jgi:hypothetical protein